MRLAPALLGLLTAVVAIWGIVSLAEVGPLTDPLGAEQLDGWQLTLAVAGVLLYGLAALGYLRLYLRGEAACRSPPR